MPKAYNLYMSDSAIIGIYKQFKDIVNCRAKWNESSTVVNIGIDLDNMEKLLIQMIKDLPIVQDVYKVNYDNEIYSVQIPVSFLIHIDINNNEYRKYLTEWWHIVNKYLNIGNICTQDREIDIAFDIMTRCIIPIILPDSAIMQRLINKEDSIKMTFEDDKITVSCIKNDDTDIELENLDSSQKMSQSYVDTISHVSRIESDMTNTLFGKISSFSQYAASIANNQYNAAYVIDMFMRSVIGIDFCQEGSLETPPLRGSNGMNPIDLGYGICNTFQSLMLKQATQLGMSDDEIKNNAAELATLARDLVMSIISDMYTVSKEMVSIQNSIIWFYRIDDVEFDKSMNTGRFVKFEYKKSNNQILISVKPFSIQL